MPSFEVLGTGTNVNPTRVSGWKNLAMLFVGASILFWVLSVGQQGGSWLGNTVSGLLGMNVGGSSDESAFGSIGGGF